MPDPDFDAIVARLRADQRDRRRARIGYSVGVSLCLLAVALILLGGVKGAMLAVVPWLLGLIVVIRTRTRR